MDSRVLGFIAPNKTSEAAVEIDVLAVRPDLHRQGVGRALVAGAEEHLRAEGAQLLHLKTLGPSHPDEDYARTREFYAALGFSPLFETTALWGEEQPCLVLVKRVTLTPGPPSLRSEPTRRERGAMSSLWLNNLIAPD